MTKITRQNILKSIDNNIYELTFLMVAGATLSSFVLSHIVKFIPCTFCWYQRILMFPLPLILGAAVLRRDKMAYVYVLPLSLIGMLVSAYHSLLQWGIIKEVVDTCSLSGPSCAKPEIMWLGFLTIPFGSFLIFSTVSVLMLRASRKNSKHTIHEDSKRPMLYMVAALAIATLVAIILIKVLRTPQQL